MDQFVSAALAALGLYLAVGFLFGIVFVLFGVKGVDPAAKHGTWGFRIVIIPGCAIFWPYLLVRWIKGSRPPEEASAHRNASKI